MCDILNRLDYRREYGKFWYSKMWYRQHNALCVDVDRVSTEGNLNDSYNTGIYHVVMLGCGIWDPTEPWSPLLCVGHCLTRLVIRIELKNVERHVSRIYLGSNNTLNPGEVVGNLAMELSYKGSKKGGSCGCCYSGSMKERQCCL